jgi:hypothetical protein
MNMSPVWNKLVYGTAVSDVKRQEVTNRTNSWLTVLSTSDDAVQVWGFSCCEKE